MDKKQLYTALSRTTNLEYIHLSNELLNKRYIPRQQPHIEILNSYFNRDYDNGKIYEIVFEKCDKIYVGSTCQELQDRLHEHVIDKKSAVYKYRNDKLKIELLVYAPCEDKKSLIKVKTEWIHDYSTKYGDRILNKMSVQKVERKEIHYKVELETEKQLQERFRKLGITLRIKDDVVNKLL